MNLRKLIFVLSILTTVTCLHTLAQTDTVSLKTIITKTAKLANERPPEKVYLQMDKPYYAVGDTIWFKAYLTIGAHQPSDLSKVIYIDIISSQDTVVQSLKIPADNGVGYGNIALTQALYKQGNYHISAYTNWMRNFDPAYFFNKTFAVGNPVDNLVFTHVSFKNDNGKINAHILYKDQFGNPYTNKKVSWKIETGDDKAIKGKETTDQNGILNLNIVTNKSPVTASNWLFTAIDLGNRKTVTNSFPLKTAVAIPDVQFFPEGGNLINTVPCRVAFKAIKPDGLGADVKGTITDNDGKSVAEFKSQHLGMGSFVMVPESGKTYKANVVYADGVQGSYELPKVQQRNISLAVYNINVDSVNIRITTNSDFYQQNQNKVFYIMAQSGGYVYYAAQTILRSQFYSAPIPKSKFPTGIVQFTLFAANGEALSERIIFIQRNDMLNLSLNAGRATFAPRQKVKMMVTAKNNTLPVEAGLSVAVINEAKIPFDENTETTILTSLLLSADLKGYIEKPNYYFNHPNDKTAADLDLLMMTQGYRRFLYKDIIANKLPPVYFLPEQGIEVTGTLRNQTGMPISKGSVRLLIHDKNYSTQTVTDMSGNFKFTKLMFPDSAKVTLNARNNVNANNLMIMLNSSTLQGISPNINAPDELLNIDSAIAPYLKNTKMQYNSSHMLREVQIKAVKYVKKPSHSDFPELAGLGMEADHTISGDRLKDCPNFASCIETMSMGLTYDTDNLYVTRDYNAGKKMPVQIYFNGMPVDFTYLNSVNAAQVESVEIFTSDGLSGINRRNNTNGVLVINSKVAPKGTKITQQQLQELFPPKYLLSFTPKGYDMPRQFYSPKYTGPAGVLQNADLRTTIYWNPKVTTDKITGTTALEYFNADGKGTYRAVVEGMDADGNIGRFVYRYKVE